jgi:type VI secretion system protein VasG
VLFIDEAHTLVGAQPSGGTDAANLLKPALARGELRTIAATTFREHKKYFEKDAALERRFQKIVVEEPDEAAACTMLRGLVATYERAHGVRVRGEAIEAAVRLSKRYVAGRQLPDSCVDVLDTTMARVRGSQVAPPLALVEIDAAIAGLERERDAIERERLDLPGHRAAAESVSARITTARAERDALAARWKTQRDALERLLGARRALTEAPESGRREREIDERVAREAFEVACGDQPLVAAEVDARGIASTIEAWTGVPIGDVQRTRTDTLRRLEQELDRRVLGQCEATRALAEGLRIAQAGLRPREAPAGVFLLVGPSGVGKTETAHAIADLLYGGDRFLTTINLSEYQEKHTVSRLVGSPPGYVGYGEGGRLTEAVRLRPHSVVLLDECEKADLEVMNVFYQLFDRGELADGEGRRIDFRNTVVLLTSNLASDRIAELVARGVTDAPAIESQIRPALAAHFAPALLARMTVVPYVPLSDDAIAAVTDLELGRVGARALAVHGVHVRFASGVRAALGLAARDPSAGVRHLRTTLERRVLAPMAVELLAPRATGATFLDVDLDPDGHATLAWSAR